MAKPKFDEMSEEDAKDFIFKHIKKRFTKTGPIIGKLPKECREDAINEVFIDLWKNRFNYNPEIADFTTYAYNRGRGVVKAMLQAYSRINKIRSKISKRSNQASYKIRNEGEDKEYCGLLMSVLSDQEREILKMRFIESVDVVDIAKIFNLNPQKIYAIIRDARMKCMNSKWSLE